MGEAGGGGIEGAAGEPLCHGRFRGACLEGEGGGDGAARVREAVVGEGGGGGAGDAEGADEEGGEGDGGDGGEGPGDGGAVCGLEGDAEVEEAEGEPEECGDGGGEGGEELEQREAVARSTCSGTQFFFLTS